MFLYFFDPCVFFYNSCGLLGAPGAFEKAAVVAPCCLNMRPNRAKGTQVMFKTVVLG